MLNVTEGKTHLISALPPRLQPLSQLIGIRDDQPDRLPKRPTAQLILAERHSKLPPSLVEMN
jgi:hypothetical protein